MRIAIDFDDTIVDTTKKVKEYLAKYNLTGFNDFEEKRQFYIKHIDNISKELQLKPYVKEVLNELSKNNELYIITARSDYYSKNVKPLTKEFIKNNNLPVKEIYFDCFEEGKAIMCDKLNIDLFIDDKINNCLEVKKIGIDVLLFNNKYENLNSVDNWLDILKYVKKVDING